MNRVIKTFIEMVSIDSPSGEEQKMALYIKSWLDEHDYKYRQDNLGSILAIPKNIDAPHLLICAHMDTVEPCRGIKPLIKNGYIKTDGSTILGADNKAALAAILTAIDDYQKKNNSLLPVELLFTVREETGGGVEFFPFKWIKSKKGIIYDYSRPFGRIITSAPFIYNFKVKFIGKGAHASRPEEGKNSLIAAAKFIVQIPQGKFDNGKTTINVGLINGGKGINIIPAETLVQGEVRSSDKKKFKKYLADIEKMAKSVAMKNGIKLEFKLDGYCDGYAYSSTDSFIKKIESVYKQLGLKPICEHSTGISDANPLVGAGIQMVNVSDGVENAHATNERISVDNLTRLPEIITKMILELSK